MTTPSQARSNRRGNVRTYAWPPGNNPEIEVVSVTTAIGNGLPKPYLVGWAAKVTAEAAVEDYDIIGQMLAKDNPKGAVDYLKQSRFRDMAAKADRGTIVHSALEAYVDGVTLDEKTIHEQLREAHVPTKMYKTATAMISGLKDFLDDEEPEIVWSEATVYSRKHGYAGTADLIAKMRIGDTWAPVILDIKTSKAIYNETALQLAAYARADFVGKDDGTEVPLFDDGSVAEYGIVVRPKPTGGYEKAVFDLNDEVFALFLACLEITTTSHVLETVRRP